MELLKKNDNFQIRENSTFDYLKRRYIEAEKKVKSRDNCNNNGN